MKDKKLLFTVNEAKNQMSHSFGFRSYFLSHIVDRTTCVFLLFSFPSMANQF